MSNPQTPIGNVTPLPAVMATPTAPFMQVSGQPPAKPVDASIEEQRKAAEQFLKTTEPKPQPIVAGKMRSANVRLKVDKNGSEVSLENVTPAEMLLLVAEHHQNAGGDPIIEISNEVQVNRTNEQELSRLATKYARNKIVALFPGANPNMPTEYQAARTTGTTLVGASSPLLSHKL